MKIYAITKGDYSDYHICALTTSKDKAEKLKNYYSSGWEEAFIEEFEDGENGELNLYWRYDPFTGDIRADEDYEEEKISASLIIVRANDEDHARKKAQDMIAEYKARKERLI